MPTGHTEHPGINPEVWRVEEHLFTNAVVDKTSPPSRDDTRTIFLKWGPLGRDDNQEAIKFFPHPRRELQGTGKRGVGVGLDGCWLPVTTAAAESTFGPHTKVLEKRG